MDTTRLPTTNRDAKANKDVPNERDGPWVFVKYKPIIPTNAIEHTQMMN